MNITDVEDRIIAESQKAGLSIDDVARHLCSTWSVEICYRVAILDASERREMRAYLFNRGYRESFGLDDRHNY